MSVIQREVSIAAGAVNENLLSGSAFEFLRAPSFVSIGLTAAATGTFATIQSGSDIVAEEFSPAIQTRFPIVPDEFYYSDFAAPGDRLVIRVRNPTGGAIIVRCIVQVAPTGG
jgi:hypothetical protein